MYLKRITITGFKSFAAKTVLELTPGITAVVGPNGSGKSNIADAVRWVLGEQSGKSLRAKKGEDIIFAGTDKQARASAAEVVLLLDNSDGRAPLDVAEIQISRKLYRSGESEYRLNERKVRLVDLEHLLAQSGFGTESYTVVGQGMVDGLILASPAERKVLFDEASGIKEFEIKRLQANRKLEQTRQNVLRIRDVMTELAPRLVALERSAKAAEERKNMTADLENARTVYVVTATEHIRSARLAAQQTIVNAKRALAEMQAKVKQLEAEQREFQQSQQKIAAGRATQTQLVQDLEKDHENLLNSVSVKKAELQFAEEKASLQADIKQQLNDAEEALKAQRRLQKQLVKNLAEAQVAEQEHSELLRMIGKKIDSAQRALATLRTAADQTSSQEYVAHALSILKQVSYALNSEHSDAEQIKLLVYKAGRLLGLASRSGETGLDKIKEAQHHLTALMKEREQAHEPYTNAVIKLRSVELDISHNNEELVRLEEHVSQLRTQLDADPSVASRAGELDQLIKKLENIAADLHDARSKNYDENADTTEQIFELATKLETFRRQRDEAAEELSSAEEQVKQQEVKTKELDHKIKSWFSGNGPSGQASSRPVEELEKAVYILEAKLQETKSEDAAVLDEYDDTLQRHNFLTEQLHDLETAATDIEAVVSHLDKQIKATFERNFAAISQAFSEYFKDLFGGGRAELKLEEQEGAYGIEISAVPPGKRLQGLATLSGGERALTGTALLAAILSTNPSPFVVLDEIDAALDEANSGRLGSILSVLTRHSQLIIITHNRQIMAAADSLYGVTMDTNHVSKLLSVRFEKAAELAARH